MSLFTLTVPARHVGVEYRHGVLGRILPAGRHPKRFRARVTRVDLRESLLTIAPQEILTSDGVSVRVSAVVRWAVVEPVAFLEESIEPLGVVHVATQLALREALAGLTAEEVGRRGARVDGAALTEAVSSVAAGVGVKVREVVVRDVILPIEIRRAATELVAAKAQGLAALEAARSESAALRSLANSAKLLDAHPALAQLRLVQAAPMGTRLVMALGGAEVPAGE